MKKVSERSYTRLQELVELVHELVEVDNQQGMTHAQRNGLIILAKNKLGEIRQILNEFTNLNLNEPENPMSLRSRKARDFMVSMGYEWNLEAGNWGKSGQLTDDESPLSLKSRKARELVEEMGYQWIPTIPAYMLVSIPANGQTGTVGIDDIGLEGVNADDVEIPF